MRRAMPRSPSAALAAALLVLLTGTAAAPAQQAPPAPAAEPAPFNSAPAPGADTLFPAPNTTRPAPPPVADEVELRTATPGGRRVKKSGGAGDRMIGQRRQPAANPNLVTAAADPVEVRIAYRRAETEARRDPVFRDLQIRADLAHDDEDRRAILRRYYTQLFDRVRRLNRSPALAAHVATLSRAAELRYAPKRRAGGLDEREAGRNNGNGR